MFTTIRRPRQVTVLIYGSHSDAEAAIRTKKGRSVFTIFGIPQPANVGLVLTFTKRNVVAIDVTPNTSNARNVSTSRATPGFSEAVDELP